MFGNNKIGNFINSFIPRSLKRSRFDRLKETIAEKIDLAEGYSMLLSNNGNPVIIASVGEKVARYTLDPYKFKAISRNKKRLDDLMSDITYPSHAVRSSIDELLIEPIEYDYGWRGLMKSNDRTPTYYLAINSEN